MTPPPTTSRPVEPDPLELLTPDEVCALFKVRKSWLYDTVERGGVPVVRLGKQLRFRRADLTALLEASAVTQRSA